MIGLMNDRNENIILIDLPTFPKGVISLSLLSVASCLSKSYPVKIVDLNFIDYNEYCPTEKNVVMFGLKVSSQNFQQAIILSKKLKSLSPSSNIFWGGELPSLLPDLCLEYADSVLGGLFEPIADAFITDLKAINLQQKYFGENKSNTISDPDFSFLPNADKYYQFMGYPLETSRGCTEKCIFCMVHTMQKKNYNLISLDALKSILPQYKNKFINVVDYNFGVDGHHVIKASSLIKESGAVGWMAEMCIELLDNDEVLAALKDSRCKMIYCGLESIDQQSLNSVHKMNTNHIENYERIIRKVQSYGIQIAAGIILGLEGTHQNTFEELFKFYQRMGIIYAKLTFLTYNPGTKAHEYVKKKGVFLNEKISSYDGNQLTYLPSGVDARYVESGATEFIGKYYSLSGIVARSFNTKLSLFARLEFILFNLCYRKVYLQWLEFDTLRKPENIKQLVELPFEKSNFTRRIEKALHWVRLQQMKN
jgi:radical SAM superfamily enzyme YgiQ (UPF0313 family)